MRTSNPEIVTFYLACLVILCAFLPSPTSEAAPTSIYGQKFALPQLKRRVPCEKRGRLEPSDNRWNRNFAGRPQPPTKINDGGALKNRFARIPTLQRAHHKFRWEQKHKKPNIPSSLGGSHTAQHDSTINLSFLNSSRLSHPPSAHSSFCFVSL